MTEEPLVFPCAGEPLVGVLHRPQRACRVGVVVVVGGPQYRVGSHRQFVQLARELSRSGYACLRFDCRGMGDSAAPMRDFRHLDDDIRAAVDTLFSRCEGLVGTVLWGLCDGASAALIYAPGDARVQGVVAVNPWVRDATTFAQVRVRHYYLKRLFEPGLWSKIASGRFRWRESLGAAADTLRHAARRVVLRSPGSAGEAGADFRQRMAGGWRHLCGRVLVVASGNDLTAQEFLRHAATSPDWQPFHAGPGGPVRVVAEADHTFSNAAWSARLIECTTRWLDELPDARDPGEGARRERVPAAPTLVPHRQGEG